MITSESSSTHKMINTSTDINSRIEELQILLDVSSGLYEAKSFDDLQIALFKNLTNYGIKNSLSFKLGIYNSDEDQYTVLIDEGFKNHHRLAFHQPLFEPVPYKDLKYFTRKTLEEKKGSMTNCVGKEEKKC